MRCEIVFYKNTRKQSAYDLQDIKTQTMRQFQKNMQELSCLQKACQTATNIMSQAEILQGRISGTPQKFFFDDFDLTPMLQERLKSLEGRNEEKYSNKRASIENCKEILAASAAWSCGRREAVKRHNGVGSSAHAAGPGLFQTGKC